MERANVVSEKCCHQIISSLLAKLRHDAYPVRVPCAGLLCSLLSDRRSVETHDDLSRAIWGATDNSILEFCMKATIENATTDDQHQPFLLNLLSILGFLLEAQNYCDHILGMLGAESLEALIYLIKPKEIKIDFLECVETQTQDTFDSETPPLNNLSRMDEKSICIEQEDEKDPHGLDSLVRIAAASILAQLVYCSSLPGDEGIGIVKSRICAAVNGFIADFNQKQGTVEGASTLTLDLEKRSLRLQRFVGTAENEDFLASLVVTSRVLQRKQLEQLRNESHRTKKLLEKALERERKLEGEKQKYLQQCRSQATVFQREMDKMKNLTTMDARQLVAIHVSERSQAESRARAFSRRVEQAESEVQEARVLADESHKVATLTKEELQIAISKSAELRNQNEDLSRQIAQEESKASELAEELQLQGERLDTLAQTKQELEEEIHTRDQGINDLEQDKGKLQYDLEELFANMVSMGQIFQHKENDDVNEKERNDRAIKELQERLASEEHKNDSKSVEVNELREENDKLYKKLAKYKDRLEKERQDRQEEANRRKRNGPVSYINQLHTSSASDRSRDRSTVKGNEDKSMRERSRRDKENSYSHSISSQKPRKHY